MHHPFHVHGAGRFLVLSRDGVPEPNLVWKDTVLTRTGETVDILLDVTNPGLWMAHCHIAEHHESGMELALGGGGDPVGRSTAAARRPPLPKESPAPRSSRVLESMADDYAWYCAAARSVRGDSPGRWPPRGGSRSPAARSIWPPTSTPMASSALSPTSASASR